MKSKVYLPKFYNYLKSYLPTKLPTGMTEFNSWMESVLELAGPIADRESMVWLISHEIMHIKSGTDAVPKRYFVKVLRKFAANQLAAATVNDLRAKKEVREKEEKQKAEDSAKFPAEVLDVQKA